MGNTQIYCEKCKHIHNGEGVCCGKNAGNICPECLHHHIALYKCGCKLEGKETIEKTKEIPNGVRVYSEYEDVITGYNKVMKEIEVKEPYTVYETVTEQQPTNVLVTKYKTENYTDYVPQTISEYCPYQGSNGYISYRTVQVPVAKSRQVSYTDYETQYTQVSVTKPVTHYNIKHITKEVQEPVKERQLVNKTENLYKSETYTELVDRTCHCTSKYACRCAMMFYCGKNGRKTYEYCTCGKDKNCYGENVCIHIHRSSNRTIPKHLRDRLRKFKKEKELELIPAKKDDIMFAGINNIITYIKSLFSMSVHADSINIYRVFRF